MATQGILKLIVDPPNAFNIKNDSVEEFHELNNPTLKDHGTYNFIIPQIADTIRTIFLTIDLPSLPGNMVWKNDIFPHLIKKITITFNTDIELTHQYIVKMANIDNYPQQLLLRGLSGKKLFKISKKNHKIILPIPIQKIFDEPHEIVMIGGVYSVNFIVQLNLDFLSLYNLSPENLKMSLDIVYVFYDIDKRNKLFEKYDPFIHEFKISLENI